MREVNYIYIHASECPGGGAAFIRNDHKVYKGFSDIGYHDVICNGLSHGEWVGGEDGEVQEGRPYSRMGAHARGCNKDSLGICLIGSFQKQAPTKAQMIALRDLLVSLCEKYSLDPITAIKGHRDCPGSSTDCPGDKLYNMLPCLRFIVLIQKKGRYFTKEEDNG